MISYDKPCMNYEDIDIGIIENILSTGNVCKGVWNNKLSEHFCNKFNVKYAITCSSCTDGLIVALHAANFINNRILVPGFTWGSTLYSIACNNAIPIFGEIDKNTWLLDYHTVDRKRYDSCLAVDVFGNSILNLPENVPTIIDAAHGYGSPFLGQRGIAEVVSLSYTKVITGMQGGVILTNDEIIAEKCQELVNDYSRLCEINAYIALVSARNFDKNQKVRKRIIQKYKDNLEIEYTEQVIPDYTNNSVFAIKFKRSRERNKVVKELDRRNIQYKVYYKPLTNFRNTLDLYDRILCLPVYKEMEDKIEYICEAINLTCGVY